MACSADAGRGDGVSWMHLLPRVSDLFVARVLLRGELWNLAMSHNRRTLLRKPQGGEREWH